MRSSQRRVRTLVVVALILATGGLSMLPAGSAAASCALDRTIVRSA